MFMSNLHELFRLAQILKILKANAMTANFFVKPANLDLIAFNRGFAKKSFF